MAKFSAPDRSTPGHPTSHEVLTMSSIWWLWAQKEQTSTNMAAAACRMRCSLRSSQLGACHVTKSFLYCRHFCTSTKVRRKSKNAHLQQFQANNCWQRSTIDERSTARKFSLSAIYCYFFTRTLLTRRRSRSWVGRQVTGGTRMATLLLFIRWINFEFPL